MPYMLNGRRLRVGRPFNTATASYSQLWATALSEDEKTAIGITWEPDPAPFDSKYYFSAGNPRDVVKLKSNVVEEQKKIAGQTLSSTDWYVVRKSETDVAIPSDVATYRASVRTACNARETEINAVSDTAALEALMKAPDKITNEAGEVVDNPAAHLTPWPKLAS